MPYRVTSERDGYRFINQVPRNMLATEIIRQLVALGFTLKDFQKLVQENHINSFHVMSAANYQKLIEQHPEMDFIYSEIQLKDNERIHFHTNWTVSRADWYHLAIGLEKLNIKVETIPTKDSRIRIREKEKI